MAATQDKAPDLSVTIAGVELKNPVMPGSGTFEVDSIHDGFFDPGELGAIVNKTIFKDPRPGNPPPRIWETPSGMLNAIGIPGIGIEAFVREKLPRLATAGTRMVVSIAGTTSEEWWYLAERIEASGMGDFLELDLSCPNLQDGIPWATDRRVMTEVISGVRRRTHLPVIAKLSPAVHSVAEFAKVAEDAGASALSILNTFQGMAIDVERRSPILGNVTGGLSGPAIRPLALYAVWSSHQAVSIPIIGVGGIDTPDAALQFILAGATAVAVGTATFVNPGAMRDVILGLQGYLTKHKIGSIRELIGAAQKSTPGSV
jgi:dihydroorotate dehydrogenase (NAD+) catalytic subunit